MKRHKYIINEAFQEALKRGKARAFKQPSAKAKKAKVYRKTIVSTVS